MRFAARLVSIAVLAVACEHGAPKAALPLEPAALPTPCESKARADAIAEASACWQLWGVQEPRELLRPMTTADGARVCLTPKTREGCVSSLVWTVQLTTKAGESVERDVAVPPAHVALFDFDGDGVQELVLSGPARGRKVEGAKAMSGYGVQILHLRAALDEMPSTPPRPSWIGAGAPKLARATIVRDVDGDGRPDLIFERFFEVALYDWDTDTHAFAGPPVVARSRPDGTFSFDERLDRACEHVPPIARAELVELFASTVCAASRGGPLATIESAYRGRCRDLQPPKRIFAWDFMAMCKRGENAGVLTDDVPAPVHDWIAAITN